MIADEKQYLLAQANLKQINRVLSEQINLTKDARVSTLLESRMISMQSQLEEELANYDARTRKVERQGDFIITNSGKRFWLEDPRPEDIDIEDIAHALARLCRFTGHSNKHASIAEHSVNLCDLAPEEYRLFFLLHDAAEFILNDISTILKRIIRKYSNILDEVEKKISNAIYDKYNVYYDDEGKALLKTYDTRIKANELRDGIGYISDEKPIENLSIEFWDFETSKQQFLDRFNRIYHGTYNRGSC